MTELPLVSVLVPSRNEETDILECIRSVVAQDYPHDRMELIVVDAGPINRVRALVEREVAGFAMAEAKVVENAPGTTPSNLNRGLAEARGDVVCRVDARSRIPRHYVARCVEILMCAPDVVVVGGAQVARARVGAGVVERGIARALRNPYATGGARYRRRRSSGPTDTVYLGAFRRQDLLDAGGWDERYRTNQDFELNRRLARRGVIWFDAGLEVEYCPRRSLYDLAQQYRRFGRWKAAGWLEGHVPMSLRHAALLSAPLVGASLAKLGRQPVSTVVVAIPGALVLDAASREPAAVLERLTSVVAMAVFSTAWVGGVAEQFLRYAAGDRLLDRP